MLLRDCLLGRHASVRDALTAIDMQGVGEVLIVDDDDRLVGRVGEQQLRRALLGGCLLDDPIQTLCQPVVTTAKMTTGRAEVLDLMAALGLRLIPVVDDDGRVVGVHTDVDIAGPGKRPNWAVIMAGGRGTRLGNLTKEIPKPMLPVAGRPILERLVLHLVGSGIDRIFLSVNYLANIVEKYFGDGSEFGCTIEYLREEANRPLGSGGALALLGDLGYHPTDPILVMNGDLVTGFSVGNLLEAHANNGAMATVAVSEYQHEVPFGVLEGEGHRLVRIVEKPTMSWRVNAGIYVLEPELLTRVPHGGLFPITKLFEESLSRGERLGLWPMSDDWQDIGRPDELARARGQG